MLTRTKPSLFQVQLWFIILRYDIKSLDGNQDLSLSCMSGGRLIYASGKQEKTRSPESSLAFFQTVSVYCAACGSSLRLKPLQRCLTRSRSLPCAFCFYFSLNMMPLQKEDYCISAFFTNRSFPPVVQSCLSAWKWKNNFLSGRFAHAGKL